MMKYFVTAFLFVMALAIPLSDVIASDRGDADAQRQNLQAARDTALNQLYDQQDSAREEIENATGYAVFPGLAEASDSSKYVGGILHNNRGSKDLYMKMLPSGGNGGDFNVVLVFHTAEAFNNFKDVGWDFSGQLNSNAESPLTGVGVSGAESVMPGTTVYRFNQSGVSDQAGLQGTKFKMNEKLN